MNIGKILQSSGFFFYGKKSVTFKTGKSLTDQITDIAVLSPNT